MKPVYFSKKQANGGQRRRFGQGRRVTYSRQGNAPHRGRGVLHLCQPLCRQHEGGAAPYGQDGVRCKRPKHGPYVRAFSVAFQSVSYTHLTLPTSQYV